MNDRRRTFLAKLLLGSLGLGGVAARVDAAEKPFDANDRASWVALLIRVATPILANLANNQFKQRMPVEGGADRRAFTHLEAFGRTLAGVAPWFQATGLGHAEEEQRKKFADLAKQSLSNATDPVAADCLNFTAGSQNLVDAAFLAMALGRAPRGLWETLDRTVQERIIAALQSTRKFKPGQNNWLLFSALIEAFLASVSASWKPEPIDAAMRAHEAWYKGDGAYGDGADFHWDYYNSFVIQPMLIEVLELIQPVSKRWTGYREKVLQRARRYAAVQERLIASDGSYPAIGRSITYRCGAFHHLAFMALRRDLPQEINPAQIRGALGAVIQRTLSAPNTFDKDGWLRIGLAGSQPSLAERYISTGSLYLCTLTFVPLGLSPADEFWAAPAADWTARKIWSGVDLPPDHALK